MNIKNINGRIGDFCIRLAAFLRGIERGSIFLFLPALFFLFLSAMTLIAPNFVVALVSAMFLLMALGSAILAWKFVQVKNKVIETLGNVKKTTYVRKVYRPATIAQDHLIIEDKEFIIH